MKTIWERHNKLITYTGLLVMGLLYHLPLQKIAGIPHFPYEDAIFHISRIIGMSNVWKSPVNFLNFHHNGSIVNLCYPWLTIYPAYLLYRILGSYIAAYKIYYLLLTILTLFLGYDVLHQISENRLSAFSFAVLYTFSSYRFENLFHRSAMGEVTAITLWLLVFFGLYHVFFGNQNRWGFLTAGMALLAYTHNLSLLIASLITGLTFLVSVWYWDNRAKRIRCLVYAVISAIFLSLGSLVPMLELFSTDALQIPGGTGLSLQLSVFDLPTLLEKMLHNEPSAHSVGLIVFFAWLCLCVFFIVKRVKTGHIPENKAMNLFALTGTLVLFAVSKLLPWEWIGKHTFLRQLQFVWRLHTCPTLFILASFSWYLPQMLSSRKITFLIIPVLCLAVVGVHYRTFLTLKSMDHARIFEDYAASGYAPTMDYAPLRAKQYRDETHDPYLDDILLLHENGESTFVDAEINISADGNIYDVIIDTSDPINKPIAIDLPVYHYTNQICELNGKVIPSHISARGGTLINIDSDESKNNQIRIYYRYTDLAHASHILSGVSAILLSIFFISRKKNNEQQHHS